MNGMKPTIGIEFDNECINAKNNLIDFAEALTKLTNTQREQLAREFIISCGVATSFEQFVSYMNNGGQG